jgi:hypothetical protein
VEVLNGPPNTDDPWWVASLPVVPCIFPSQESLLPDDVRTSMTPPDLKPNSGGTCPTRTLTDSTISGSGAMPCALSIRSYIGMPSTTYRNPSSTPRACIRPLSSVAHPGVVAIASCRPRLLMRIGARRTASPASVVRVVVVTGCVVSAVTFTCSASAAESLSSSLIGTASATVSAGTTASNGAASALSE